MSGGGVAGGAGGALSLCVVFHWRSFLSSINQTPVVLVSLRKRLALPGGIVAVADADFTNHHRCTADCHRL